MERKLKLWTYEINECRKNKIRFLETNGFIHSIFYDFTEEEILIIKELNENKQTKKTLGKLVKIIYEDLINQQK